MLSANALALIGLTLAAVMPPFDYPSLNLIISALLIMPVAGVAIVCDPPRFKILSIAHLIFAVLFLYVTLQAFR